jgi:hypothetical protein
MRKRAWVLAALSALMIPSASMACGNSYYHRVEPRVKAIQDAEGLLQAGQVRPAAENVLRIYPRIASKNGSEPLESRARAVMALAVVRNGGRWPVEAAPKDRPDDPAIWAVRQLRAADQKASSIPRTQSDLAEALGAVPDGAKEATKILEGLAEKKVIPSAHAWATLARLRKAQGNENAGWAALAECRKRARYNGVCRMQPPQPGAAAKNGAGGSGKSSGAQQAPAKKAPPKSA